jgi:predicted metal-dependent peptidase
MKAAHFESLLQELIDENPFAIRAALQILKVEYTSAISTLAVTCEAKPRMLVNLGFLARHAHTEIQVKAVVVHEFLHVLLRHTEGRQPLTAARHLAFDAVINAIIHRQYGDAYSSMMSTYYGESKGLQKLLRPMNKVEIEWLYANGSKNSKTVPPWAQAWNGLYCGRLVADDIEGLAASLSQHALLPTSGANFGPFTLDPGELSVGHLLGNHDDLGQELQGELAQAVDSALKQMNGHGIWRSPRDRGVGGPMVDALFSADKAPLRDWEAKALALIRRYITTDRNSRNRREEPWSYRIPVLSPADRRAFLRAQWSPFLPESAWEGQRLKRDGTAQVYLDVSGSMNAEMPLVIGLLNRLGRHIRRPFWAFSDEIAPAVIENGQLRTSTTGGTSMQCVLEHVAKTRPDAAIVVTDGYIESISPKLVAKTQGTRLHVLVTRGGNPGLIAKAGLSYTQLEKVPS